MPKSNRKGYFVMKLRDEGIDEQIQNITSTPKGIKKEPKVSAKQARQRKKLYITHLQQRILEMTEYTEKLKKQNTQLVNQCQRLKNFMAPSKQNQKLPLKSEYVPSEQSSLKIRFEGLFKQIKNLSVNLQAKNILQISRSLSVLRDKYGISGRERIKYIEEQFDRIIGVLMPLHYRLLMENCENNKEFYSLLTSKSRNRTLVRNQQREREILINVRPQIIRQRQQFDKILVSIAQVKAKISSQNFKCQRIVDEMQDNFDPIFVGRLLLDLDFCRSKQNLDEIYPVNYWEKLKNEGIDIQTINRNRESCQNQLKELSFKFEDDMEIINSLFS